MKYDSKNQLLFHNKALASFAKKWSGPVYVYSKAILQERIHLFMKEVSLALGQRPLVHYAMKANSHPQILKLMLKNKIGADVVSFGEMKKALAARIPAKNILFSGVGKTEFELTSAIRKQDGQINVESLAELSRIVRLTEKLKKNVEIGLRVNPEVNPDTHPYIATGFKENKFGIEFSQVQEATKILKNSKYVKLNGLSLHIGSQLFDFQALAEAIEKTLELEKSLKAQNIKITSLDIGGGVGVRYDQESSDSDKETLQSFCKILHQKLFDYHGQIRIEPGRFLVARAGVLLTQVQYIKRSTHKNFIICDSGMNHLLRPALYQAKHRISSIIKKTSDLEKFDIVGPVCESSDVLARDQEIVAPNENDILAIHDVGAYGYSMASNYNSFPMPKEIFF